MKKIITFLVLACIVFSMPSCTLINGEGGGEMETQKFTLYANVIEVGEKLEVEVVESDYAFGIYWIIVSNKTELFLSDGTRAALSDIKAGDKIEIVYNGQTMLSYPPQIVALSVRVVE